MKEQIANEDGKSLVCNEWGFQILLFTAQKYSGDFQNLKVLPTGDESVYIDPQCSSVDSP